MEQPSNSERVGTCLIQACYNVCLGCLSKSSTEEFCLAAEDLLYEMENLSTRGNSSNVRPNTVSYSSVIRAFSNIGDADKAETILERLIHEYVRTNDHRLRPSTQCFNNALQAWAQKSRKSQSPDAPARAEALLDRMRRLHKTADVPVKPDVTSYNILMDVWGHSAVPGSDKRVLAILQDMIAAEDGDIAPSTISYNIAINAFAQTGNFEKAEWLLQSMYEAYDQKQALWDHSVAKPNLVSWNSLLSAYAKSRNFDAVERAERALERMDTLYSSGVLEGKPDTISFNCLLHCLAKSSRNDAGVHCEQILEKMESRWAAGDKNVKPDFRSVGAAIQAWLKQNNLEKAEVLLCKMCRAYANGEESMKPSIETLRNLLEASRETSDSGESIKQHMKDMYPHILNLEQSTNSEQPDDDAKGTTSS